MGRDVWAQLGGEGRNTRERGLRFRDPPRPRGPSTPPPRPRRPLLCVFPLPGSDVDGAWAPLFPGRPPGRGRQKYEQP